MFNIGFKILYGRNHILLDEQITPERGFDWLKRLMETQRITIMH